MRSRNSEELEIQRLRIGQVNILKILKSENFRKVGTAKNLTIRELKTLRVQNFEKLGIKKSGKSKTENLQNFESFKIA